MIQHCEGGGGGSRPSATSAVAINSSSSCYQLIQIVDQTRSDPDDKKVGEYADRNKTRSVSETLHDQLVVRSRNEHDISNVGE